MDTKDVHEPQLPGVRTLHSDSSGKANDTEGQLTTPGAHVEPTREASTGKQSFDVERAYNEDEVQIGTIVTDKKKSKNSVGAVLKTAFSEWWGNTQQSVRQSTDKLEFLKPKEVPTIEPAEARTEVIKEAAKYSKQAPRDDHAAAVEKIRTLAHDAEQVTGKPFAIKPVAPQIEPTWSSAPEEVRSETSPSRKPTPSSASSRVEISPLPQVPRGSLASYATKETSKRDRNIPAFTVSPAAPKPEPKKNPPAPRAPEGTWSHYGKPREQIDMRGLIADAVPRHTETPPVPPPPPIPHVPQSAPPLPPPPSIPRTKPAQKEKPEPEPVPKPVPINIAEEPTPPRRMDPELQERLRSRMVPQALSVPPSHLLRNALLTFVAIVGVGGGIYVALHVSSRVTSEAPLPERAPVEITIPAFIATDVQTPLPLPQTSGEFLTTLQTQTETASAQVSQFYPTIHSGPASTADILGVLSPHIEGSFMRALQPNMMLGAVGTQDPYIILQSSNFDVAFAGMLAWEPFMSRDLVPFFGNEVTLTFLPSGNRGMTDARFIDAITSNQSIRILYDEFGEERIVYGFVNSTLIVITTSTEALAAIIERIK